MNPKSALIELHFLPSIEYICALQSFDQIILEKHEHFNKQSFRNRCYILTSQGKDMLTVPLTGKHGKISITDIRIDQSTRWQTIQWRTIVSAYANAPYFEHYRDALEKIIFSETKFLYDLNFSLLSFCLQSLGMKIQVSESVSYEKKPDLSVSDLRSLINTKNDYSIRPFYRPLPYLQVFGNTFVENLSVMDLLFSEGPHSHRHIKASGKGI
ncbi:MAG TPA: WbqC family protein [Cyclobacteriaceae bacterium]|nr:WbqC family protein [Cyclobacteriaceae bacterium]